MHVVNTTRSALLSEQQQFAVTFIDDCEYGSTFRPVGATPRDEQRKVLALVE